MPDPDDPGPSAAGRGDREDPFLGGLEPSVGAAAGRGGKGSGAPRQVPPPCGPRGPPGERNSLRRPGRAASASDR